MREFILTNVGDHPITVRHMAPCGHGRPFITCSGRDEVVEPHTSRRVQLGHRRSRFYRRPLRRMAGK